MFHSVEKSIGWCSEFDKGLEQIVGPRIDLGDPNLHPLLDGLLMMFGPTTTEASPVLKNLLTSIAGLRNALQQLQDSQRTEKTHNRKDERNKRPTGSTTDGSSAVQLISQQNNHHQHQIFNASAADSAVRSCSRESASLVNHSTGLASSANSLDNSSADFSRESKRRCGIDAITNKLSSAREEILQRKRKNVKNREMVFQQLDEFRRSAKQQQQPMELARTSSGNVATSTAGIQEDILLSEEKEIRRQPEQPLNQTQGSPKSRSAEVKQTQQSAASQQREKPLPTRARILLCGVEVLQSNLWSELSEKSRKVTQDIAKERPTPPGAARLSMRCYCSKTEPISAELKAKIISLTRKSKSPVMNCFDNGIECIVCSCRDHIDCAISWVCSVPGHDNAKFITELTSFLKNYICIGCRVILVEPFAVVEKLLALSIFRAPPLPSGPAPTDPQATIGKSVQLTFRIPSLIAEELKAGRVKLQIRGFEVNPLLYRFSGYPYQVTFWVNTNHAPGPDFMIKPPVQHRKRKDIPFDIPTGSIRFFDLNTINAEIQFLISSAATSCYMLAVVVVKQTWGRELLESVKSGSVVPVDVSRNLSRALLDEANKISEEDEVQQVTEAHHITLTCPSTLMRMTLPGRGVRCLHTQCFDIPYYIESQETVPSHRHRWKCPVCDKPCLPYELFIDSFFKSILDETTEGDRKAYLDASGGSVTCRVTERVEQPASEYLDHDADSEDDRKVATAKTDNNNNNGTTRGSAGNSTVVVMSTGTTATTRPAIVVDLD